jgi:hypothetical protein
MASMTREASASVTAAVAARPTARRSGARDRAAAGRGLRRQATALREPRRLAAVVISAVSFGVIAALLLARGNAAGADALAYWAGVRAWLAGLDPYLIGDPYLPYVYPPWTLPLLVPWALLPWDIAWFVWRTLNVVLLMVTYDWAYRRHPLRSAVILALLALPLAANLDTGNINTVLVVALWAAQFSGPVAAGLLWALATAVKWVPLVFLVVLAPRARLMGVIALAFGGLLSLLMLPQTLAQLQGLFGFGPRPIRLDYLVFAWAFVPWWYRHPDALWWLRPASWPRVRAEIVATIGSWTVFRVRLRRFLGLSG